MQSLSLVLIGDDVGGLAGSSLLVLFPAFVPLRLNATTGVFSAAGISEKHVPDFIRVHPSRSI
jgi:hypothetical protein